MRSFDSVNNFMNPSTMPAQLGLYSHVATASTAGLVFVAGQLSVDHAGKVVGPGDVGLQLETVVEHIGAALASVGLVFDDIVQMTTYLTDRASIAPFYDRRADLFPRLFRTRSYPPNTLLIASGLVLPEALIEIQVIASTQRLTDGRGTAHAPIDQVAIAKPTESGT